MPGLEASARVPICQPVAPSLTGARAFIRTRRQVDWCVGREVVAFLIHPAPSAPDPFGVAAPRTNFPKKNDLAHAVSHISKSLANRRIAEWPRILIADRCITRVVGPGVGPGGQRRVF